MNANEIYKTLDKLTKRITIIKDMLPLADSIIVFHCYADIEKIKFQVDKINKEIENARRLSSSEYSYNSQLGFISLNQSLVLDISDLRFSCAHKGALSWLCLCVALCARCGLWSLCSPKSLKSSIRKSCETV